MQSNEEHSSPHRKAPCCHGGAGLDCREGTHKAISLKGNSESKHNDPEMKVIQCKHPGGRRYEGDKREEGKTEEEGREREKREERKKR